MLEKFHGENQASTLYFQDYTNARRSVFEWWKILWFYIFPTELLRKLRIECLAMQNHKFGISPKKFLGNAALSSFFRILTTSKDENGKVYVSTVQAYNYPVTDFQWHPEKNAFEWGLSMIPHSEDAVQVTQHVATTSSGSKLSYNALWKFGGRFKVYGAQQRKEQPKKTVK
ncbi:gamma-glutamyl hydrolase 2-like [Zingiber officinale]|uniref:gamma-glutamyl hydrolase 2-like n=1 Tax=Zingiber officinale TaxID=94328 RepID=UPI001C4B57E5|nr:gamma-glutamyl hydrolase 2-like [Zingiber officinale]